MNVRFLLMFLLWASSVFGGGPIENAIMNGAGEGEFKAAIEKQRPQSWFNGGDTSFIYGWYNSAGESYLQMMARHNRAEQIDWIMAAGAQLRQLYMGDSFGKTPLERALECGSVEAFRKLYAYWRPMVEKGFFTRYWREAAFTLYHMAAYYNQAGIIRELRDMGGVPHEGEEGGLNALNAAGETALDVAIRMNAADAEAVLREIGAVRAAQLPLRPVYLRPIDATETARLAQVDEAARTPALDTIGDAVEGARALVVGGISGFGKLF